MKYHSRALLLLLLVASISAVGNDTVILPPGASNHGDPRLLCLPAKWSDVLLFFLLNYIAHAATVVLEPGSSPIETASAVLTALLLPGAGLYSALHSIKLGMQTWRMDDFQRAQKAGALCANLQEYWTRDELGHGWYSRDVFRSGYWLFKSSIQELSINSMPSRRRLSVVPSSLPITKCSHLIAIALPSDRVFVRTIVAMAQVAYGIYTLYNARGDQINRYGYAAFGLSVAPYAYMPISNGIAGLLMPSHPALIFIELRPASQRPRDELLERNGQHYDVLQCAQCCTSTQNNPASATSTDGSPTHPLGEAMQHSPTYPSTAHSRDEKVTQGNSDIYPETGRFRLMLVTVVLGCAPLVVIGILTHFQAGAMSETGQKGWALSWILSGIVAGPLLRLSRSYKRGGILPLPFLFGLASLLLLVDVLKWGLRKLGSTQIYGPSSRPDLTDRVLGLLVTIIPDHMAFPLLWLTDFVLTAIFAIPSIGGMVNVARMISDYGVCRRLD